jgi:CubicO group peptidase (beta-lactamase class C family)
MHVSCTALANAVAFVILLAGCAAKHQHLAADAELRALPAVAAAGNLSDNEIHTILQDNVGPRQQADGLVVGIVDEAGGRVIAAGTTGHGRPVDGDTIFRIGSITKVFTGLLLQDMVERGEMKLDDPAQVYLPDSVRLPTRGGKQITLFDLATHTSGLPRDGAVDSLAHYKLRSDPGTHYEYSNLGVALLGEAIARKAGTDYESLLIERICKPLSMDSTRVTVTSNAMQERTSVGHGFPGRAEWSANAPPRMPGAGSLHSTGNDLLKFLSANLGLTSSPLTPFIQKSQSIQQSPSGRSGRVVWFEDAGVIEHGGLVAGFGANLCIDPATRRGVFILANCSSSKITATLPRLILANRSPRPQSIATIDAAMLDNYVGDYDFGRKAQTQLTVRRDAHRLLVQVSHGEPRYPTPFPQVEVFPQSDAVFANAMVEKRIAFVRDKSGRATKVIIDGYTGVRMPTPPIVPGSANNVDFIGQYRPAFLGVIRFGPTLHISRRQSPNGDHLIARVTGLPGGGEMTGEIYAFSPSLVFSPDMPDLSLNFNRNRRGKITGVVARTSGRVVGGTRVSEQP